MAKSQDAKKVQKKEPLKTAKEKKEEKRDKKTIQNEIKKTSPELEIIEDFFITNF
jgi:hypothetical protein